MTQSLLSDYANASIAGKDPPNQPLLIDKRFGKVTCWLQSYTSASKLEVAAIVWLPTITDTVLELEEKAQDVSIDKDPLVLVVTALEELVAVQEAMTQSEEPEVAETTMSVKTEFI